LTYTLKPTKQLSAELKDRLSLNKVNSQSVSNLTRQWNVDANLFYKFTERLSVSWQNSYCHYVDMHQHVLFSDVSARYDFGRFEVSFVARNLGNKQTYQQELITTDYQVFNRYQLRPREYEVKFSISY
jgi:outer membrane receptor protein involved in Fe transport